MSTKADFYSGLDSKWSWLGSLLYNGDVWNIPSDIFLQVNKTMYEEMVLDFIRQGNGIVHEGRNTWPWMWADSRCTDYSYIFLPEHEKVYMVQGQGILVDPIKIIQGESLIEANANLGAPTFPIMKKDAYLKTEELLQIYGYKPSQIV